MLARTLRGCPRVHQFLNRYSPFFGLANPPQNEKKLSVLNRSDHAGSSRVFLTGAVSIGAWRESLSVTMTHSRPHVSDDNPYSESYFKTLKDRPDFPEREGSIEDARAYCRVFSLDTTRNATTAGSPCWLRRCCITAGPKRSSNSDIRCLAKLMPATPNASPMPDQTPAPAYSGLDQPTHTNDFGHRDRTEFSPNSDAACLLKVDRLR